MDREFTKEEEAFLDFVAEETREQTINELLNATPEDFGIVL